MHGGVYSSYAPSPNTYGLIHEAGHILPCSPGINLQSLPPEFLFL